MIDISVKIIIYAYIYFIYKYRVFMVEVC